MLASPIWNQSPTNKPSTNFGSTTKKAKKSRTSFRPFLRTWISIFSLPNILPTSNMNLKMIVWILQHLWGGCSPLNLITVLGSSSKGFWSTSLPLASTGWAGLTLSSLCPLLTAVRSITLNNSKRKILGNAKNWIQGSWNAFYVLSSPNF